MTGIFDSGNCDDDGLLDSVNFTAWWKYSIVQVVKYDGTFGSANCKHEDFFCL